PPRPAVGQPRTDRDGADPPVPVAAEGRGVDPPAPVRDVAVGRPARRPAARPEVLAAAADRVDRPGAHRRRRRAGQRGASRAGAGIGLSFDHVRPAAFRDALLALLDDPSYRAAAGRVATSFAAAGGADAAAKHLETLTARP